MLVRPVGFGRAFFTCCSRLAPKNTSHYYEDWRTSPREFLNMEITPHCEEEATRSMNPSAEAAMAQKETHNDHTRGCKVGRFHG
jgi:hypothetical protein